MSKASQIAKAKLAGKLRGRAAQQPRVADVAAAFQRDEAQTLQDAPGTLYSLAADLEQLAAAVDLIGPLLAGLAAVIAQPRQCPKCETRIAGDDAAAAGLHAAAAEVHTQAASLRTLAGQVRAHAREIEQAAGRIGAPGATLWFAGR